jgi:mannose-6-phosphate isomerase-like protein (cupin superfamily)
VGHDLETFELLGFDVTLLDGGAEATFSAQEWHASAGAGGIPVHVHHRTEEAFYVVDGAVALWRDDRSIVHQQGSYIVVPPGQPHTFWNPAETPATYLTVISPKGFERYLVELASGLRDVAAEEDAAALRRRLGTQYDISIVGPPPDRR